MRRKAPASPERWLKGAVRRIARGVRPERVVLFGSYAYGKPRADSDLDLLVIVKKSGSRDKRYEKVDRAIGEHVWPVDLLVRDAKEVADRLKLGDTFMAAILRDGKVLYES